VAYFETMTEWVNEAFKSLSQNTNMDRSFVTNICHLLEDPFYEHHPAKFLVVVTTIEYKNDGSFDQKYRGNSAFLFADDFLTKLKLTIERMGNQEFDCKWYEGSMYPYEFQFGQMMSQLESSSDSDSGVSAVGR